MGSTSKTDVLTTGSFSAALNALLPKNRQTAFLVAYSGGVDSHALLHLCVAAGLPVRAAHVHHGLQAQADDWVRHCQSVCDALGVELSVRYVDASPKPGESPEAAARAARYAALDEALQADEVLLLAQHKNDQAETVMLQLLRGAGAAGLSAMPQRSVTRSGNVMLRPLLGFTRRQIESYAHSHRLQWINDPSNLDTRYRRNALRQQVLPQIEAHFPQAVDALHRVAQQQQQNRELLDELAQIDLADCIVAQPRQLRVSRLRKLSSHRRFNVLRYWLHSQHTRPNRDCIEQIERTVLEAAEDATPVVSWNGFEARRFGDGLHLLNSKETEPVHEVYDWRPDQALVIPALNMQIQRADNIPGGLDRSLLQRPLQLRFRRGGEIIRPQGSAHHQPLKKWFQQAQIPPWRRQRIPLLYLGDELLAVVGYCLSADHCVAQDETGWSPRLVETTN